MNFLATVLASIIFVGLIFSYPIYTTWKDYRGERLVTDAALKGNKYAIAILVNHISLRYTDYNVLKEAINGNENALKILRIKIDEEKK